MIGETLGHYRIEAQLGEGGMGVVYRARDTLLQRNVAVKVLSGRLQSDAAARSRLLGEARAASALNHPNICTIHEVAEAAGRAFIVMEYVEGRPLNKLVSESGLPIDDAVRYGSQIASALAHAHERGVVHRDLKSLNIMVTPEGRPKVLDFGLAKRLHDLAGEETRSQANLETETLGGTLAYMAPEVLRNEPVDARSDLWALGVIFYEMTAGALPFRGQSGFELSSAILRESPAPLPAGTPPGLSTIIQRCLMKEPGQRYQRAGEVQAALEAIQAGTAVAAGHASPRRWHFGRRWLWGMIALTALMAVALVSDLRERRRPPPLSSGGLPSPSREANEYFERAWQFHFARDDQRPAREMVEKALALDPQFAEARALSGILHWGAIDRGESSDTGLLYRAEQELRQALQTNPDSSFAHGVLAAVYLFQGRKEMARAEAETALKLRPDDVFGLNWLGHYHRLNGDFDTARTLWERGLERQPLFWPIRMNLGELLRLKGDTAGAIRHLEKMLEEVPQSPYALRRLAHVHIDMGDLANARKALESARPEDRNNYRFKITWAILLALEGQRAAALQEMDAATLRFAEAHYNEPPIVAGFYAILGDASKALDWLDRAVRLGDERVGWFRRDPLLKNIRNGPRFKQMMESIEARRRPAGR